MTTIGRPATAHGVRAPQEYVAAVREHRAGQGRTLVAQCLAHVARAAEAAAKQVERADAADAASAPGLSERLMLLDNAASALRALLAGGGVAAAVAGADVVHESGQRPTAYVSDGRWVCDCSCGNSPSVDPEWRLAVCFRCGAIIRPLVPPDVGAAEAALLARPHPSLRHYFPGHKEARKWGLPVRERAPDLERQNLENGLPARAGAVGR